MKYLCVPGSVAIIFIATLGMSVALECWGCTPGAQGLRSYLTGQGDICQGEKIKITCKEGQEYCIKIDFEQGFNLGCSSDRLEVGEGCYDGFYYYGKLGKSRKSFIGKDASSQPLKCYCTENLCNSASNIHISLLAAIVSIFVIFYL